MTFKHTKFEDSPIMRSLEKVAREKGLVKEEPIAKTASAPTLDLTPANNLMSNVLKLCAGLRASGFGKYASDLELAYLNYKRANTLYETSKEKGEDLIDAAHPKGTKLDIEGDHIVDTILNNHLKMVSTISKKPTGKLASSKDVLGAVKTVLAQDAPPPLSKEQKEEYVSKYIVERARQIRDTIARPSYDLALQHLPKDGGAHAFNYNWVNSDLEDMQEAYAKVTAAWYKMMPNAPTVEFLWQMIGAYNQCINESDIENTAIKGKVVAGFRSAAIATETLANQLRAFENDPAKNIPEGIPQPQVAKPASPSADTSAKIATVKRIIGKARKLVPLKLKSKAHQDEANGYLAGWEGRLKIQEEDLAEVTKNPASLAESKPKIEAAVAQLDAWVRDFGKRWLKEEL